MFNNKSIILIIFCLLLMCGCIDIKHKKSNFDYEYFINVDIDNPGNVSFNIIIPFFNNYSNENIKSNQRNINLSIIQTKFGMGLIIQNESNIDIKIITKSVFRGLTLLNSDPIVNIYSSININYSFIQYEFNIGNKYICYQYIGKISIGWNSYTFLKSNIIFD